MCPSPRPVVTQAGEDAPASQAASVASAAASRMRRIPPGEAAPRTIAPEPALHEDRLTAIVEPCEVSLKLKKRRGGVLVAIEQGLNDVVTEYAINVETMTLTIKRKRS
jgi:hypothetical protein